MSSILYEEIYARVSQVPPGSIVSYGQVAAACGLLRGARVVGWALGTLPGDSSVPWQRVVNRERGLSIVNPHVTAGEQKARLEEEGRTLVERDQMWYVTGTDWFSFPKPENLLE